MKIAINNTLNNIIPQCQAKYGNSSPCKGISLTYQNNIGKQADNPFGNYLNFTGGINKISVVKSNTLEPLLRDLIDFKGDNIEFAKHTFSKMKKYFGYEDVMVDNFKIVDECKSGIDGAAFNCRSGDFEMDKESCLSLSRPEIVSVLGHEFEHFFQFDRMFRSEEIGIEKYLKEETLNIVNKVDSEFYVAGIEVTPEEKQKSIDIDKSIELMNMDFWNKIIRKKGIIKKGTLEAKQAKEELEALMSYKPYLNMEKYTEAPNFPKLQGTIYYDYHKIGDYDYYWNNPMEIGARKAEKSWLDTYLNVSKEPYTPSPQIVKNSDMYASIERFMGTIKEKFESNDLPNRFKADVYDEIVSELQEKNPKGMYVIDCIKEADKTLKTWTTDEVEEALLDSKYFIEKGYLRFDSPKETDDFMKYVNNFMGK